MHWKSEIISFICPLSWTSIFFCVIVFKFFNPLTFSKRALNQAVSREKWITVSLCCKACDWLFANDVTFVCTLSTNSGSKPELTESWWSASWYQQSRTGVIWFCQCKTNPVTLSLLHCHHGTGPWFIVFLCKNARPMQSSSYEFNSLD